MRAVTDKGSGEWSAEESIPGRNFIAHVGIGKNVYSWYFNSTKASNYCKYLLIFTISCSLVTVLTVSDLIPREFNDSNPYISSILHKTWMPQVGAWIDVFGPCNLKKNQTRGWGRNLVWILQWMLVVDVQFKSPIIQV